MQERDLQPTANNAGGNNVLDLRAQKNIDSPSIGKCVYRNHFGSFKNIFNL
jgi:hypothetical protein